LPDAPASPMERKTYGTTPVEAVEGLGDRRGQIGKPSRVSFLPRGARLHLTLTRARVGARMPTELAGE
jgi:hypothetical protein